MITRAQDPRPGLLPMPPCNSAHQQPRAWHMQGILRYEIATEAAHLRVQWRKARGIPSLRVRMPHMLHRLLRPSRKTMSRLSMRGAKRLRMVGLSTHSNER